MSLQAAYDACGPGEGYDKLLVLDPANIYTGMLTVTDSVRSCIHGNGALIHLNNLSYRNSIRAWGQSTVLDMDHCIIRGANEAVGLHDGVSGTFSNNTFYDCGLASMYGMPPSDCLQQHHRVWSGGWDGICPPGGSNHRDSSQ